MAGWKHGGWSRILKTKSVLGISVVLLCGVELKMFDAEWAR